jgi:hypothetical protein
LVNCQQLLCTDTWRHSKLARRSCKIRREKHPRAFVKVVEGSEIYNFPIHHFVHFYSKFGRKSRSNRGTVKQIAAGTRHCASRCAGRAVPPPRCPGPPAPSRGRPFPRSRTPSEASRAPSSVGARARACRPLIRVVPDRCPPLPLAVLATPLVPSLPPVRRGAGRCPAHPYKPKVVSPCAYKHPVTSLCSVGAINGSRSELRAPAGCAPSRARLYLPWHLP